MMAIAVPLWIMRIHDRGGITNADFKRTNAELQPILERADTFLLFKGKEAKKGEVADAFNKLAEGIATLSFVPGGIKIFNVHYRAEDFNLTARTQESSPPVPSKPKGFIPKITVRKLAKVKPIVIQQPIVPAAPRDQTSKAFQPNIKIARALPTDPLALPPGD